MDQDGGYAEHQRQQEERDADHAERMTRIHPTEEPVTEDAVVEEKPKPKPRARPRAKSSAKK